MHSFVVQPGPHIAYKQSDRTTVQMLDSDAYQTSHELAASDDLPVEPRSDVRLEWLARMVKIDQPQRSHGLLSRHPGDDNVDKDRATRCAPRRRAMPQAF